MQEIVCVICLNQGETGKSSTGEKATFPGHRCDKIISIGYESAKTDFSIKTDINRGICKLNVFPYHSAQIFRGIDHNLH